MTKVTDAGMTLCTYLCWEFMTFCSRVLGLLENWLGFGLSPTTLYEYPTIKTLAEYLNSLQNQKLEAKVEELYQKYASIMIEPLN